MSEIQTLPVLPLRDIVVFPHMVVPLFVGREKSVKRARGGDEGRQVHPARHPEDLRRRRSRALRHLRRRRGRHRAAAAEAPRRHREGAGGGQAARGAAALYPHRGLLRGRDRGAGRGRRGRAGGRGAVPRRRRAVRELRQAEQEGAARGAGRHPPDRRARQAGRLHRRPPVGEDRRQAGAAGDLQRRQAAGEGLRPDGGRDLRPAGREEDQVPRQAPDGEDAARILPERTDEGDPARAGRAGRSARRADGARKAHQEDQALQGGPHQGRRRAEEAPQHEPDVGRIHGGAELPGLAVVHPLGQGQDQERRHARGRAHPGRGPLRPGEGQGAHPGVPRGPVAHGQPEGADPVPRRASGRRQDLARPLHRQGHGARVRAACRWAACGTRRRSAATGGPTSARCPARSSSR